MMTSTKTIRLLLIFTMLTVWLGASRHAFAHGGAVAAKSGVEIETGLEQIATRLAERLSARKIQKVAVIEFSNLSGYDSALGLFIAEELTTGLLSTEPISLEVVERQQLSKVLEEQSLSSAALFDAKTIAQVGAILGIQAIVTGSIADQGDTVKINARAISVETAQALAGASIKAPKEGVVDALMRQGVAPELLGTSTPSRPMSRNVQASDVFFQNAFLRITVDSFALSEDRKEATLALRLENLTTQELFLALEFPYGDSRPRVRMIDDRGMEFFTRHKRNNAVAGIAMLPFRRESNIPDYFTAFSPKGRSTVVIPFWGNGDEIEGNFFAVGLDFLRHGNDKISRFSAGMSNIVASQ